MWSTLWRNRRLGLAALLSLALPLVALASGGAFFAQGTYNGTPASSTTADPNNSGGGALTITCVKLNNTKLTDGSDYIVHNNGSTVATVQLLGTMFMNGDMIFMSGSTGNCGSYAWGVTFKP